MAEKRNWLEKTNSRGTVYRSCERKHVALSDMLDDEELLKCNGYLGRKDKPSYPEIVFKESKVCHVTDLKGCKNILRSEGFKRGESEFLFWSLAVPQHTVNPAQFQEKFTTSPAFQTRSPYGNFRFTFRLTELLAQYKYSYCGNTSPILRVFGTQIYKKEIAYIILVHPKYIKRYKKYPRLPIDDRNVCGYGNKTIYWRCQSPSDNYEYCLEENGEDGQVYARRLEQGKFFVWDKVIVAFHMGRRWILEVERSSLLNNLSACETFQNSLLRNPPLSLEEAEREVQFYKAQF